MKLPAPASLLAAYVLILSGTVAFAGGGPQNVLVVVNDQSIDSQAVGQLYQDSRSIHPRQVFAISVPPAVEGFPATYSIPLSDFTNLVRNPILNYLQSSGLTGQVDRIVFAKDIPYIVNGSNGLTSAMFYGYKSSPASPIAANTANSYYYKEAAFSGADYTNAYFLCSMLNGWTRSETENLISRAVLADYSAPTGTIYLIKTTDPLRNQRYRFFDNLEFLFALSPDAPGVQRLEVNSISNRTDVMGYTTGLASIPNLDSNTFLNGAVADHLTSFGGRLFNSSQMSIMDFVREGVAMTHGTVIEPFAFTQKFPHPMQHFWAARGFTHGESMWMSLGNPYNGLVIGDLLCAPWANPPSVSITNLTEGQTISGLVNLQASASSSSMVSRLDLFIDDRFFCTMTNLPPEPGNVVSATIDGSSASYTVQPADTLLSTASGLAQAINASNLAVTAIAYGDRLTLMSTNDGYSASHISCSATSLLGSASRLTIDTVITRTNLLDSWFPARELIFVESDPPDSGNQLRATITLDGGPTVTNVVTAGESDTVHSMVTNLMAQINADPQLSGSNGVAAVDLISFGPAEFWLEARTPGPQGARIHVLFSVINPLYPVSGLDITTSFSDDFNDNITDIRSRATMMLSEGQTNLTASCSWDTTTWPNGSYELHTVAYEGRSTRVQGHHRISVVVSNSSLNCQLLMPTNGQIVAHGTTNALQASVTGGVGSITQMVFLAEGREHARLTTAPWNAAWTNLTDGPGTHRLRVRTWDSTGAQAISAPIDVIVQPSADADFDQMDDDWERRYFGGILPQNGNGNADGDPQLNAEEFVADTVPTNPAHFFQVIDTGPSGTNHSIVFTASTNREYQVDVSDLTLTTNAVWQSVGTYFPGSGSEHTWIDTGSTNTPHPSLVTQRLYRVRVRKP